MSGSTLELGGEPIVYATGGTLEAEYAMFDPGDIELAATGPGTIREYGYRTTVGEARGRLTVMGLTRELAEQATASARPAVARAFARGPAVRGIVERLDAAELFDGRVYDPGNGRYKGAWLDLPALVNAISAQLDAARAGAATAVLQGLHLAALLAGHSDDVTVVLTTAEITLQRRPSERTFKRLALHQPAAIVEALHAIKTGRDPTAPDVGPGRREIIRWLRERALRTPSEALRYASIESTLGARNAPVRGPLADAELWALETMLSMGETEGVAERLDAIERRGGRLPATTYLRARVAFMAGTDEPRAIAERVSALSTSMAAFHELQLLAAQAWASAGDVRRAHAFARHLSEDTAACDALRMHAREVLDATGRATTAPEGGIPLIPKPPLAPSGTELYVESSRPPPGRSDSEAGPERGRLRGRHAGSWSADLSLPSHRLEPRAEPKRATMPAPPAGARETQAEDVESLSLPPGNENEPPNDEPPRTPQAARLACTFWTRALGRELRIRHGAGLRTDVDGLELAQRYLLEAVAGGSANSAEEERAIMRNGAFLSELLARRLGAYWIDLEPSDPARWAMLVPSRAHVSDVSRTWPLGRVLRFVAQRHKERDLVSYYLELEAFAR